MSTTLWPDFTTMPSTRGMTEMLYDAADGLTVHTNNKLDFLVDAVGDGAAGGVKDIRYNCFLRLLAKTSYTHLLFQVTAPPVSPFPAKLGTPEGEEYPNIQSETELRDAIRKVIARERTKEVVLFLMNISGARAATS